MRRNWSYSTYIDSWPKRVALIVKVVEGYQFILIANEIKGEPIALHFEILYNQGAVGNRVSESPT